MSTALRYLTVTFPVERGLVAVVGIGDLAFLGTFHRALVRLGKRPLMVSLGLVSALLVALAVGLARGWGLWHSLYGRGGGSIDVEAGR